MTVQTPDLFNDLLCSLDDARRQHSLAVGHKVASVAHLVPAFLRADLVVAATLHDIGYSSPSTGHHAIDGAALLAERGFSGVVCNLVAHHSASTFEAVQRGLSLSEYERFAVDVDLAEAQSVLWWADMTTGPLGSTVTVEDRLLEICSRYGGHDVVTQFIDRARPVLLAAGQSPLSSSHGSV